MDNKKIRYLHDLINIAYGDRLTEETNQSLTMSRLKEDFDVMVPGNELAPLVGVNDNLSPGRGIDGDLSHFNSVEKYGRE